VIADGDKSSLCLNDSELRLQPRFTCRSRALPDGEPAAYKPRPVSSFLWRTRDADVKRSCSPIPAARYLDHPQWLQTTYGAEVVTFTADLGQGEELEPARRKAEMLGIRDIYIEDVREEFRPRLRLPDDAHERPLRGLLLLGTSIARPLIAKRLVEIAHATGADAIAHGRPARAMIRSV